MACGDFDLLHEIRFAGQIMDSAHQVFVPILRRLSRRPPDRINRDLCTLALEFRDLSITERLPEGREPLEHVGDAEHGPINGGMAACKGQTEAMAVRSRTDFT